MKLILFLHQIRYPLFFFLILILLAYVFLLPESSDPVIILTAFVWVLTVIAFRLEARFSILSAILFLFASGLFLWLQLPAPADKLSVCSYVFLCIGIVQQAREIKAKIKNLLRLDDFFKKLWRP